MYDRRDKAAQNSTVHTGRSKSGTSDTDTTEREYTEIGEVTQTGEVKDHAMCKRERNRGGVGLLERG